MNKREPRNKQDHSATGISAEVSQSVLDSLSELVAVIDPDGSILAVNEAWRNSHLEANACTRMNYLAVCRKAADCGDKTAAAVFHGISSVLEDGQRLYATEYPCHGPDGQKRWFFMRVTPLTGKQSGAVITHIDITADKLAQGRQQFAATLFDALHDGVLILDQSGRVLTVNQAYLDISGFSREACIGTQPPHWQQDNKPFEQAWRDISAQVELHGRWQGEMLAIGHDGVHFDESLTISKTLTPPLNEPRFIWVMRDITTANSLKNRLQLLASTDQLTGLLNRDAAARQLEQHLHRDGGATVAVLDIDGFTDINVSLGHQTGNTLLKRLARQLQQVAPEGSLLARSGADEFICILLNRDSASDNGNPIASLQQQLAKPYQVSRHKIQVTLSVGIASYPIHGDSADALFQHADMALSQAQKLGRGAMTEFDPGLSRKAAENLFMANNLPQAIRQGQLHLNLQPRAKVNDQTITGFEVLVRWHHPEQGRISPADFIRIAEETGLIHELGQWVLEQALGLLARLTQSGLWQPDWRLAINVSSRQFKKDDFAESLLSRIEHHQVLPQQIELEITEGVLMEDPLRCRQILQRLRQLGVRIAIDDFGTGYSSLYYLKHLAVDVLKIDQAFVSGLPDSANDCSLVRAILAMARSLGLEVIAEGVETQAQCDLLAQLGCDQIQGYLLARPSRPEVFFPD